MALPLSGACNVAPVVLGETAGTPETRTLIIDVLANDSDADGDPLTVSIASHTCGDPPALGAPSVDPDGQTLVFEPFPVAAAASCVITYTVSDTGRSFWPGQAPGIIHSTKKSQDQLDHATRDLETLEDALEQFEEEIRPPEGR